MTTTVKERIMDKDLREDFKVGEIRRNKKGKYIILETINDGYNFIAQYDNGNQEQLSVSIETVVMKSIIKEEEEKKRKKRLKRLKPHIENVKNGKPIEEYIGPAA